MQLIRGLSVLLSVLESATAVGEQGLTALEAPEPSIPHSPHHPRPDGPWAVCCVTPAPWSTTSSPSSWKIRAHRPGSAATPPGHVTVKAMVKQAWLKYKNMGLRKDR